ncbi:hypothetical protein ACN083_00125 [Rothia sp. CCM 9418]|uniref:hypothetical protein n=1 Tax=Rothia sp. CCM 9418 TaxID=3402661 RepID=UPI003AE49C94
MNSILYRLNDPDSTKKYLFWYWIISPLCYFLYTFLLSSQTQLPLEEVLNAPLIALTFLIACMTILLAGMLNLIKDEGDYVERNFGIFAMVQQLLVGNLLGVLLAFFFTRSRWGALPAACSTPQRWILWAGMALISVLTVLVMISYWNLSMA